MKAVFFKEMHSYFVSPIGYVYLAAFYLLAGYQYAVIILSGNADMSTEFSFLYTIVLLLTPILTMRLMSEERKQRTDQLLLSSPVTLGGIVAGKYFSAVVVYTMGISVTLLHSILLAKYAEINWMTFWGNLIGIFLTGTSCIAVCMFISAQTENQIVAAVGGIAVMLFILSLNSFAAVIDFEPLRKAFYSVSFYSRYHNMTMGILKLSDIFFFVSFSGTFFFLTTRILEKRRWN